MEYYTEEGLKKLNDELDELTKVQRPAITKEIADARDKGDLSENAEYHAAKEAQGHLESKISKLNEIISNARIIDESQMDTSKVLILSTVKLMNVETGTEMTYQVVAENEADLKARKISVESPIGRGLLGKKKNEIARIEVPNGIMELKVIDITR
ncbi:MAG TPA: transcription elongation factor GreA [Flavobacteriales bacterium]|nr:transcription elongation factor GreA [Flavobacteriales bacterium]HIO68113.1 transcription elongation factor GreA [Flavobacteriales bacterium]